MPVITQATSQLQLLWYLNVLDFKMISCWYLRPTNTLRWCKTHYNIEEDVIHWWRHGPSLPELSHRVVLLSPDSAIMRGRTAIAFNTCLWGSLCMTDWLILTCLRKYLLSLPHYIHFSNIMLLLCRQLPPEILDFFYKKFMKIWF